MARAWTIELPVTDKPLTLNDRLHWAAKARRTAEFRDMTFLMAVHQQIPKLDYARITLRVFPPDRRQRDEDNLVATLKPCIDAIVDARVLPNDTPEFVTSRVVLMDYDGHRVWRYLLEIRESTREAAMATEVGR